MDRPGKRNSNTPLASRIFTKLPGRAVRALNAIDPAIGAGMEDCPAAQAARPGLRDGHVWPVKMEAIS